MTNEEIHERDKVLSDRVFKLTTAALVAVALALGVCLLLVVGIATARGADLDELQAELSCRSSVNTDFALSEGELIATIAEALVALERDEVLRPITDKLTNQIEDVRQQALGREAKVEACTNG